MDRDAAILEEINSWEKVTTHLAGNSPLEEQYQWKATVSYLRDVFGDDFPAQAIEAKHFLISEILAPWRHEALRLFAAALVTVKTCRNFSSLQKRLKDKNKFHEAVSVLNPAEKLVKAGFDVQFDPIVLVHETQKSPDLAIQEKESGERFYVEISILEESREVRLASEQFHALIIPLISGVDSARLEHTGSLHKCLSKRHFQELLMKIERVKKLAVDSDSLQELIEEGAYEFAFAPENQHFALEQWALTRGLQVSQAAGPSASNRWIERLTQKISKEIKQLPLDTPSVIILYNSMLFWRNQSPESFMEEIQEAVHDHAHLVEVVIAGSLMGSGEDKNQTWKEHLFAQRVRAKFQRDGFFFIRNRYCTQNISPKTIQKFESAILAE